MIAPSVSLTSINPPLVPLNIFPVPPDEVVPTSAVCRVSLQNQLNEELIRNGFLKPDGRITQQIPTEVPPLNDEQVLAVNEAIHVPHGDLLEFIRSNMKGEFNLHLIGGAARDIFYKNLPYLHKLLASLKIADPSSYDPLLLELSQRKLPDTDLRFMLDPKDAENMHFWGDLLSGKLWDHKVVYFCGGDADYLVVTFPSGEKHEVQLLFTRRLNRETLFKHELMLNLVDPLAEGFLFKLDQQQFWQAALDLFTRTLHVDNPEGVNFAGLPTLISYYARGWKLGDAHVEAIFFDKFFHNAKSEGGVVKSFLFHFGKILEKHHFSDPAAAMALAFNFCAAAKGRDDVEDKDLLSIIRQFSTGVSEDADPLLRGIKEFVANEKHSLEDLFNWVYTQTVLGRSKVAMLDHRGDKGFQVELPGKHEPLHLLIPRKYCSLSLKGSEKLFEWTKDSPLYMQAEELGVGADALWEQAKVLLSAETESPDKINQGFAALILSQEWEPHKEKAGLLLRHLPWMLAAQSEYKVKLALIDCVQHALGDSYPGLMVKAKSLMTHPNFISEWIQILADRRERRLRDISWDLWNSVPLESEKTRNERAKKLFESYLACDRGRSLELFCSFAKSFRSTAEKLNYWKRLCEQLSEGSFKPSMEDLMSAFGCLGTIPLESEQAQKLLPLHVKLLASLIDPMNSKSIYVVMEKALACNILHYSCTEVPQMWFKLCLDLLHVSPADTYGMWMLGRDKQLFIDRSFEVLKFELELAEALWQNGFQKNAKLLVEPIWNLSGLNPELKKLLLPLKENLFKQKFICLEEKTPEQISILFKEWRELADRRSLGIKEITITFINYCEKHNVQTLLLILGHPPIVKLLASDARLIFDQLYRLINSSTSQSEAVRLFFDYAHSFEKQQLEDGLASIYKTLSRHWSQGEKLPESIRQGFNLHASTLIQCVGERLDCFYFLKKDINCQVSLNDQAWLLVVSEAKKVEDTQLLHKLVSELKASGCALTHLRPLIQQVLSDKGPETLNRIREYAAWGKDAQESLSSHLLGYLRSLNLKTRVPSAIAEKGLLKALLPEDELHTWIQEQIESCCISDLLLAIDLGKEFKVFRADSLLSLTEKLVDPRYADLKQPVNGFIMEVLREDFPLEGNPEIIAKCRFACFSLFKRFSPEMLLGALRHLKSSTCIKEPQVYLQIFSSFASIAHQIRDPRSEIHQLIVWAYDEMLKNIDSFEGNPCPPIILEGFGKSGTKELLTLGYELLIFVSQTVQFDLEGSLRIKNFLIVLLRCNDPELQQRARQLIREGLLNRSVEKEVVAELWFMMIEHGVQELITPALRESSAPLYESEEMELRQLLQDCLHGFKYKFEDISNFTKVLTCLNSKTEDDVIWNYMVKYVKCLKDLYPDSPLVIVTSKMGEVAVQLERNRTYPQESYIVKCCYLRVFLKLAEDSTTMKFVSIQKKLILVKFFARWIKSFGPISRLPKNSEEFGVLTQLRHIMTLWIEQLSIRQVFMHLEDLFPLFSEDEEASDICTAPGDRDLFFQGLYMFLPCVLDPVEKGNLETTTQKRMERFEKDPKTRELLRESLTSLTLRLVEKHDSTSLAFALLIFCYGQSFVFRDSFDEASRLFGNIIDRFSSCVLTDPSWNEEIELLVTSTQDLSQARFSKGWYSLQSWIFTILKRYREQLYESEGERTEIISRYFHPLIFRYLQELLVFGDIFSQQKDCAVLYKYCSDTIRALIDRDIWQCYKDNPMNYFKIIKRVVSISLKLFDNPRCTLVQARTIAKLLHTLFMNHTVSEQLRPSPFGEVKLEKQVCSARITCLYTIAERVLPFFLKLNPDDVCVLVDDYISFTQLSYLFPKALAGEKLRFLTLLRPYQEVKDSSTKSAWYNLWV